MTHELRCPSTSQISGTAPRVRALGEAPRAARCAACQLLLIKKKKVLKLVSDSLETVIHSTSYLS